MDTQELALPIFDQIRNWIIKKRDKNMSWDKLYLAGKSDEEELTHFLEGRIEDDDWPEISIQDWKELVRQQKEAEEQTTALQYNYGAASLLNNDQDNEVCIPEDRHSAWQTYRSGLINNGFKKSSVEEIERTTLKILKRLNSNTTKSNPVKGLVIGNVQSGKTANMAALMAMAADWGWNMFIILSGTIDNLRKQTQSRLFGDLNQDGCKIVWRSLDHLKKNMSPGNRAQDMHFENTSNDRYFTVCLKNAARLRDLINWMQQSPSTQEQMKILVIDDEADQAGINTAKITDKDRRTINKLICALVNGQNSKAKQIDAKYHAMNYIGYTATPYANVLNEASEDSLYPRNFIFTLSVSKEYFGPQQIFGGENDEGLDIIRKVSQDEIDIIKKIHDGGHVGMPSSLKNAICWFMCGVACMRIWGYKKPISMLIHTSQKTAHHDAVANVVSSWLKNNSLESIIADCRNVWDIESKRFTFEKFRQQYADYDRTDEEINRYPDFEDIVEELCGLLFGNRVSHIKLDEDSSLTYHTGIHLCIDNCTNNGVDGDSFVRLAYPDKEHMPEKAPAFIVIGGATLSRGLTLEGLISTFFLRSVNQADTLMQMGRWFGYRKNYELIPRVWLTEKTYNQFRFLSELDENLRNEIQELAALGKSPAHYGPKVMNTPMLKFIRITAANRMKAAEPTDYDFSGTFKQSYIFENSLEVLKFNLDLTRNFLSSLGEPSKFTSCVPNACVWHGVEFNYIKHYLKAFKFHPRLNLLNDITTLLTWVEEITQNGGLEKWNVVIAGRQTDKDSEKFNFGDGLSVGMIDRTRKENLDDNSLINIRVLRNPKDMLADINMDEVSADIKNKINHFESRKAKVIRTEAGFGAVPQLLLYVINKNSKSPSNPSAALNAPCDIAGVCINIPGGNRDGSSYVATLSIHMPEESFNDNGDIDGTDAD